MKSVVAPNKNNVARQRKFRNNMVKHGYLI